MKKLKIVKYINLIFILCFFFNFKICVSAEEEAQVPLEIKLVKDLGLRNILYYYYSIYKNPIISCCYDVYFQSSKNKLYMLADKITYDTFPTYEFKILRASFNPTSSTLSLDDVYDWQYRGIPYNQCDNYCIKGTGAIIDPSEKYLFLSLSDGMNMRNWIFDIADSETSPVLVANNIEYNVSELWGIAITNNASRIFLSTGPIDLHYICDRARGSLLTYSFSTTEGLRLIELRGPLIDSPELGYILKSPDDSHLYIEMTDDCYWRGGFGGVFSINPYISPMQISWEPPPASNSIFDSSGKHLYSNSRGYDTKLWHWLREDDPTTNTFGLLTLFNKYENPFHPQFPENKIILSKDESYLVTFDYGISGRDLWCSIFLRNKISGSLKWIMGKKFAGIGIAYKFICPPDKNKIYILIDDEIYLFEISEDPWVYALRQVLLGNEVKSDFYDYNNDGEVSIADLIKRLNEIAK